MGKDLSEQMHYAKQLYLYGEGETKPVKNIKKLAQLAGVSERGIREHLSGWRETSTQLALNSPNSPYSLALSEDVLLQHKKEVDFLGEQVRKLRTQLAELETSQQSYHVVLGSYERALTKWEKSSGILAHYNTAESAMKERARAHERAKGKKGDPPIPKKRKVDKSRFDFDA